MFYHKGSNIQLSKNFTLKEFDCNCRYDDCNYTLIHIAVIRKLEDARSIIGTPLKLTSAFRCQRHNAFVGGVVNSQHMLGGAVDILYPKGVDKNFFNHTMQSLFNYTLIYKTFIHCDLRLMSDPSRGGPTGDTKTPGPRKAS